MKKLKKIATIFLIIFTIISLSSCHSFKKNLKEGIYESIKVYETEDFIDGKMEITYITKKEYEESNGINVLSRSTSLLTYYYKIEIFLFSTISNKEELVQITNFEYTPEKRRYYGDAYLKVQEKEYIDVLELEFSTPAVRTFNFTFIFCIKESNDNEEN